MTSLKDIKPIGSWNDLRLAVKQQSAGMDEDKEKARMLDEVHTILNTIDFRWLLARLNSQRMKSIKKQLQLESLIDPNVYDFIDAVVKSFGKYNPVSNLCLAIGAQSMFTAIKAQNQQRFSYNALIDFVLLVTPLNCRTKSTTARTMPSSPRNILKTPTLAPRKTRFAWSIWNLRLSRA